MDYYRQKYRDGLIDVKTFERMMEVLNHLEDKGYIFEKVIGEGSFGSVIKIKHSTTGEEMAAKIVRKDYASDGELNIWKKLNHDNILKLIDVQYVYYADCYIFLMPAYSKNLEQVIWEPSFKSNKNALQLAIDWLKQILDATVNLHENSLSHNDIKSNNVLIADNNTAILADFGFLASTETKIKKYGAPFIYCCPEGRRTESGQTEIEGKKLDVWAIGALAFELFSGMLLLKEFSTWKGPLSCWFTEVYPVLQQNLLKEHFLKLMKEAYPKSKGIHESADDVIDFIISCLNIVPEKRPSAHELQNHRLFGGSWDRTQAEKDVDIWKKTLTVPEFNCILQKNNMDIVPGSQMEDHRECRKIHIDETHEEALGAKSDAAVTAQIDTETIADAGGTPEYNKQSSLTIANNTDLDVTLDLVEGKINSVTTPSHHSSYIFDSPDNSEVLSSPSLHKVSEKVFNIPTITRKPSSCLQRFTKWWNQQKSNITRLLTACCPCKKISSSQD